MNEIDLCQFDLNLLVVFEVLMADRNVTRAAERLKRMQSAGGYSLPRLRDLLDDPLLIKGGRPDAGDSFRDRAYGTGATNLKKHSESVVAPQYVRSDDLATHIPAWRTGFRDQPFCQPARGVACRRARGRNRMDRAAGDDAT